MFSKSTSTSTVFYFKCVNWLPEWTIVIIDTHRPQSYLLCVYFKVGSFSSTRRIGVTELFNFVMLFAFFMSYHLCFLLTWLFPNNTDDSSCCSRIWVYVREWWVKKWDMWSGSESELADDAERPANKLDSAWEALIAWPATSWPDTCNKLRREPNKHQQFLCVIEQSVLCHYETGCECVETWQHLYVNAHLPRTLIELQTRHQRQSELWLNAQQLLVDLLNT